MIGLIDKLQNRWREKERARKRKYLESSFNVRERNGAIYLCMNGCAFARMSNDISVAEITDALERAREASMEFESL